MMPDIFSSFDPSMFKSLIPTSTLLLTLNILCILTLISHMWPTPTRQLTLFMPLKDTILSQLLRTQSKFLKGMTSVVGPLFLMIILINMMGMFPYFFGLSSHLIMTLTLGLPLWLSLIMSSFSHNTKSSVAHFLPDGAPVWLNPFLVLIETISTLVRPITLSFRLAANMTAGHIVLTLMSSYAVAALCSSLSASLPLIMASSGYILFELAICLIQAYIFCLLISLYADEHA